MSEYCGQVTTHTKKRGKIHRCDWCSQWIEIGERYSKWLFFGGGTRVTVYAHGECRDEWEHLAELEHGIVYGDGGAERPAKNATGDQDGGGK